MGTTANLWREKIKADIIFGDTFICDTIVRTFQIFFFIVRLSISMICMSVRAMCNKSRRGKSKEKNYVEQKKNRKKCSPAYLDSKSGEALTLQHTQRTHIHATYVALPKHVRLTPEHMAVSQSERETWLKPFYQIWVDEGWHSKLSRRLFKTRFCVRRILFSSSLQLFIVCRRRIMIICLSRAIIK